MAVLAIRLVVQVALHRPQVKVVQTVVAAAAVREFH